MEIYNPDPTTVNLAEYQIKQYANGETSANLTVSLTGQLAARGHYLVGHSALKEALGDAVQQQANLAFNGDDALFFQLIADDLYKRIHNEFYYY